MAKHGHLGTPSHPLEYANNPNRQQEHRYTLWLHVPGNLILKYTRHTSFGHLDAAKATWLEATKTYPHVQVQLWDNVRQSRVALEHPVYGLL